MNWETRTLMAGLAIWSLLCIEITAIWASDPALAKAALLGMGVEIISGREGGIPTALQAGVPPWLVFQLSATQDIGSALLVYPIFLHFLHRRQASPGRIGDWLRRIEGAARNNDHYAHRWGPLGIGLFMLIPFLINGPLVGLVLGRLAGIRTRDVLAPVIVATIIAAAMWTFAFDRMFALTDRVHPLLGLWLTIGIVGLIAAAAAARALRARQGL